MTTNAMQSSVPLITRLQRVSRLPRSLMFWLVLTAGSLTANSAAQALQAEAAKNTEPVSQKEDTPEAASNPQDEASQYLRRDLEALRTLLRESVTVWQPEKVGLTADDGPFLYETLARLQEIEPETLQKGAEEFSLIRQKQYPKGDFTTFLDLYQHPEEYLGEPVTFTGHTQRVVEVPGAEYIPDCDQLYEVWLYPESGLTNPVVVLTASLPESLEVGDQLTDGVTVTGIFFKRYTYRSQDAFRFAPLVVTTGLKYRPVKVSDRQSDVMTLLIAIVIVAVVGGLLGVIMTRVFRRKKHHPSGVTETLTFPPES